MSRFVYKGTATEIVAKPPLTRFRPGVPTWVPITLRDKLPYSDFAAYNPEIHTKRDKILVHVGRKPEDMFSVKPFLQRLHDKYPTCDIELCGDPVYAGWIGSDAKIINSYKPAESQAAYRHFVLTGQDADSHLNLLQLAFHPWWRMAIKYLSLNDMDDELPIRTPPAVKNRWICIVHKGVNAASTWDGMGAWLASAARNAGYAVREIDAFDPAQLDSQLESVTGASLFIACGYTPLIYAAGYAGTPSFSLIPANTPESRKCEGSFAVRPEWWLAHIGSSRPESGVGDHVWARAQGLAIKYSVGTSANGVRDVISDHAEPADPDSGAKKGRRASIRRSSDHGDGRSEPGDSEVRGGDFVSNDPTSEVD